jgi:hypothetical protein
MKPIGDGGMKPGNSPELSQRFIRAIIGVAAFAGLREGEIRGQ